MANQISRGWCTYSDFHDGLSIGLSFALQVCVGHRLYARHCWVLRIESGHVEDGMGRFRAFKVFQKEGIEKWERGNI